MDLSGIKWQCDNMDRFSVPCIHLIKQYLKSMEGFAGFFLHGFSKVFQHSYSNNIITLSPDLFPYFSSNFCHIFRTLHRGMACRSAVVKHAFWPIQLRPRKLPVWPPVLWQQKKRRNGGPSNDAKPLMLWPLIPCCWQLQRFCWKFKRKNLWNQRGPVIPKDFNVQETDAALRKAKKERKKMSKSWGSWQCCANLSFLGRLESIRFVSFASGFHLGGPASQGSGCGPLDNLWTTYR